MGYATRPPQPSQPYPDKYDMMIGDANVMIHSNLPRTKSIRGGLPQLLLSLLSHKMSPGGFRQMSLLMRLVLPRVFLSALLCHHVGSTLSRQLIFIPLPSLPSVDLKICINSTHLDIHRPSPWPISICSLSSMNTTVWKAADGSKSLQWTRPIHSFHTWVSRPDATHLHSPVPAIIDSHQRCLDHGEPSAEIHRYR